MTQSRPLEIVRPALQWAIIAIFFALLWLPTVDTFLHLDKAPVPNENRAPAKFPVFDHKLEGIRDFVAGLESYYNDHFGFRKRLIRWSNHWRRELFKESTLPNVITGRDGWLYFSGDNMIDNVLGFARFQPNELHDWQLLLETRRDWAAKRGIAYIFVVAPNKESVYPEFLPGWLTNASASTKLDQFVSFMKTNSTVEVLDLRACLRLEKNTRRLYKKTDTHWNYDGAFLAHQELIRTLSRQLPGHEALAENVFARKLVNRQGGDLAHMLGQERNLMEAADPVYTPVPPMQPLVEVTSTNLVEGKSWDPYSEPIYTENASGSGTAIVFRDSFSEYWYQFLGRYFARVIYLKESNWEPALIEKEKPVVVIDQMVERFFYTADPVALAKADNLK